MLEDDRRKLFQTAQELRPGFVTGTTTLGIGNSIFLVLCIAVGAQPIPWRLTIAAPPVLSPAAATIERIDALPLTESLARAGLRAPSEIYLALIAEDDPRARVVSPWIVGQAAGTSDIVIYPERVSSYPYGSLEAVFRHEVVHLALSATAGQRPLPRWFHEGVAVAIESGWSVGDNLRLLLAAGGEPAMDDLADLFRSPNRPDTTKAYLLATALVEDLRRRHGPDLPGRIAADIARGDPFDTAFARQAGETPDRAAERAWATYRLVTTWLPLVTSGTAVWALILLLAFVAFAMRLRQRAVRRRQWDAEDGDTGPRR